MAEELAFEERLRNRAAIERDEGPELRVLASWMARARSSFPVPLSPHNSTGASLRAMRPRFREHAIHQRAARDDAHAPIVVALGRRGREGQRPVHLGHQRARLERLGEVAEDAPARRLHRVGNVAVRREDDHGKRGKAAIDGIEEREAVHAASCACR
jgi:hypothetical protein